LSRSNTTWLGNGISVIGLAARANSAISSSSAAIRFVLMAPHESHLWTSAHSRFVRIQIPIGSMCPRHPERRSPGRISTWRLHRQRGQWLRCCVPEPGGGTATPQLEHKKVWGVLCCSLLGLDIPSSHILGGLSRRETSTRERPQKQTRNALAAKRDCWVVRTLLNEQKVRT
jgi:hypothetical protein